MKAFIIDDGMFRLVEGNDAVHFRLKRLFLTPISSVYGFMNKGSRILNYFHDKAKQETVLAILTEIKVLIKLYEKNISLKSLGARVYNKTGVASNTLEMTVEYEVNGRSNRISVSAQNAQGE